MAEEELLHQAERAALAGSPREALPPTARLLDPAAGVPDDTRARAGWLRGVALGALGRYQDALTELRRVLDDSRPAGSEGLVNEARAAATTASLLRQIGDHPAGEPLDARGVRRLNGVADPAAADARLDCLVGWAADAVGQRNLDGARRRLDQAEQAAIDDRPSWRPQVRLNWVRTEVALLAGDNAAGVVAAGAAVDLAESHAAVRHLAKSLMFRGVARALADGPSAAVRDDLLRGAELADRHDLLPLAWPIRAVLATMPGLAADPDEAERHLALARRAAQRIGAGLPVERLHRWIERDPMAAYLLAPAA